jgi:CTP synthase
VRVKIEYVDAETLTEESADGLLGPVRRRPGARRLRQARRRRQDPRGAQLRRENKLPYLGICLGMQVATIEYARHLAGPGRRQLHEFDPADAAPGDRADRRMAGRDGSIQSATQTPTWAAPCASVPRAPTSSRAPWRTRSTAPSSRNATAHRYEANENYLDRLQQAGLVISAITQREKLTEMVELPRDQHPWFVGVQFHPEFKSTPWDGHPLFISYIKAALAHQAARRNEKAAA